MRGRVVVFAGIAGIAVIAMAAAGVATFRVDPGAVGGLEGLP